MKVFLKYFATPLLIGVIASILYIVDALLGPVLIEGGSFMWVAFISWTIFFGASIKERIKGFIGIILGFVSAVIMMLITGSFTLNLHTISISCLLGVFLINCAVMFLDKTEKVWLNSITGVFAGIFTTFSGLGIGMSPVASVGEAFLMLGIIALYTVFGMACGFFSIYYIGKIKTALAKYEQKNQVAKIETNQNKQEEVATEPTTKTTTVKPAKTATKSTTKTTSKTTKK